MGANRYLSLVLPFLKQQSPDIVCLQDVTKTYTPELKESSQLAHYFFTPERLINQNGKQVRNGLLMLASHPLQNERADYYYGTEKSIKIFSPQDSNGTTNRALLSASVKYDDIEYQIATTHFTWTPDGKPNDEQRRDVKELFRVLDRFEEIVLTGDFNAPRGTEIFDLLASRYTDNIPKNITTTINGNLHRAGDLQLVVDGLFTSSKYRASNVSIECGVSDHCSINSIVSVVS